MLNPTNMRVKGIFLSVALVAIIVVFRLLTLESMMFTLPTFSRSDGICPSIDDLKANMSNSVYSDTSVLPNGYNVGDILNMPSFHTQHSWPPQGIGYTETVASKLARTFKNSVLGLYFVDQNHGDDKVYERTPSIPRIKHAVDFYGTWIMDENVKYFCDDLLPKKSTILVHLRSCDDKQLSESYVQNIYTVSKQFDTVVLTGGCHADERYANHATAASNLFYGVDLVYNKMRDKGVACKLLMFPNYNPDDALYAFRIASNVMVERGGYAALGSLLTQGNVYLDKQMKPFYDNIDFKHFISNAKLLWGNGEKNEYEAVFDKMARVVPTNCLFETFGAGDESKRMCMNPSLHDDKCWVMSIGCNGKFSFETDIFLRTKCNVHIFDCTGDWEVPSNISSRVFLHKLCVGQKENGPNFLPYEDLVSIATNKLNTRPSYLKMDIEGFEFQVLPAMLALPLAIHPVQIAFELHLVTYLNASHEYTPIGNLWEIKNKVDVGFLFYNLETIGGYKLISRYDNPYCAHCTEVVVMKKEI